MPVQPTPALLDIDRISPQLRDCGIGHPLYYAPSLPSTMDRAAELAAAGAPSGAVIVVEEQTAGRGRRGRAWHAPPATALLVSVVLRPPQLQLPASHLPMLAGVALVDAVTELAPELKNELTLKWPNDLVLGLDPAANKVGGVLVESRLLPDGTVASAVIGVGVNANQRRSDLPPVPAAFPAPTSLALRLGRAVDRSRLLVLLCRRMAAYLAAPSAESVRLAWRRRLSTVGQTVTLYPQGVEAVPLLIGHALAVDDNGSLIVEDRHGVRHTFAAGDVSMRVAP